MVIQLSRFLLETNKTRRADHRGIGGEHRLGKSGAFGKGLGNQAGKSLNLGFKNGTAVGALHKTAHQFDGILV